MIQMSHLQIMIGLLILIEKNLSQTIQSFFNRNNTLLSQIDN